MRGWAFGLSAAFLMPLTAVAQPDSTLPRPMTGAQVLIPLGSLFVPGLGQYVYGKPIRGLAFTSTSIGLLQFGQEERLDIGDDFPRTGRRQIRQAALGGAVVSSVFSAYDAFQLALPALQREGKYQFLTNHEPVGRLLTAPFDPSFLKRWTTWVDLGYTGVVLLAYLSNRKHPGDRYLPLKGNDVLWSGAMAGSAALSEEALFRGWLYPYLRQQIGPNSVLPSILQSGSFAALHLPNRPGRFIWLIGGWAAYEGWLTKRNGGSIRESIFHHFWYDAALFVAAMATDVGPQTLSFSVPIKF